MRISQTGARPQFGGVYMLDLQTKDEQTAVNRGFSAYPGIRAMLEASGSKLAYADTWRADETGVAQEPPSSILPLAGVRDRIEDAVFIIRDPQTGNYNAAIITDETDASKPFADALTQLGLNFKRRIGFKKGQSLLDAVQARPDQLQEAGLDIVQYAQDQGITTPMTLWS